jgi:Fe2+ or Zn2+ uptake regulation protein
MSVLKETERVEDVRDRLREHGKRMTPQRIAVLEALRATTSHPTAEELRVLVQKLVPTISLGTVYRNLHVLVEGGCARRLPTPQGSHRFDGDLSPHLHVICRKCGRIADVHLEIDSGSLGRVSKMTGFTDLAQRVEFRGICAACNGSPVKKERKR